MSSQTLTLPTETAPADGVPTRRHRSATRRLVAAELRLLGRDPLTLTFVLVFPIVTMLIIGGSFGTEPGRGVPGATRRTGTSRRTSPSSSARPA